MVDPSEITVRLISGWCPTLIWTKNPVGARVRFLLEPAAKEDNPDRKQTTLYDENG